MVNGRLEGTIYGYDTSSDGHIWVKCMVRVPHQTHARCGARRVRVRVRVKVMVNTVIAVTVSVTGRGRGKDNGEARGRGKARARDKDTV